MKTFIKSLLPISLLMVASFLSTAAYSATYAGQDCVARSGSLTYLTTGAKNNGSSTIYISCPVARLKDFGTQAVSGVIYFVNDGKNKSCFFDNFNIDTGGLWKWTSASGTRRLAFPVLNPTKQWLPLTFNCSLPAGSHVTGYYINEQ